MRAESNFRARAEEFVEEIFERALEVGKRDVLADVEAFELVENR